MQEMWMCGSLWILCRTPYTLHNHISVPNAIPYKGNFLEVKQTFLGNTPHSKVVEYIFLFEFFTPPLQSLKPSGPKDHPALRAEQASLFVNLQWPGWSSRSGCVTWQVTHAWSHKDPQHGGKPRPRQTQSSLDSFPTHRHTEWPLVITRVTERRRGDRRNRGMTTREHKADNWHQVTRVLQRPE